MTQQPHKLSGGEDSVTTACSRVDVEKRLRSQITKEALYRALEGTMFGIIGIIVLALISYVVAFGLFFVLQHVGAFFSLIGLQESLIRPWILLSSFSLILLLSFVGAYRDRWGLDFSEVKTGLSQPVSFNILRGMSTLVCECLFGGPRLLFDAAESLGKVMRLMRLDVPQIALILVWLFNRKTKAGTMEIASAFPQFNIIRLLPQMRDLPGVVWLPKADGIIFCFAAKDYAPARS